MVAADSLSESLDLAVVVGLWVDLVVVSNFDTVELDKIPGALINSVLTDVVKSLMEVLVVVVTSGMLVVLLFSGVVCTESALPILLLNVLTLVMGELSSVESVSEKPELEVTVILLCGLASCMVGRRFLYSVPVRKLIDLCLVVAIAVVVSVLSVVLDAS